LKPKILLWDIENTPELVYVYDRYPRFGSNFVASEREWYMLSFAYQWLGEKKIHVRALPDYRGFHKDHRNDRDLVQELRGVLSSADVIVAHNGDRHDLPKLNTRLIFHGMDPLESKRSIDTYKAAKKYFKFSANSLNHLGTYLGFGGKKVTTGWEMHRRCIEGDVDAFNGLKRYNVRDVDLLNKVYMRLRPFLTDHPNLTYYSRIEGCPACESPVTKPHGWLYLKSGKKQRYICNNCGHRIVSGPIIRD